MDKQMPRMGGDKATEAARRAGYVGLIAMVSGNTFQPQEEAAMRGMGISAFLPKMGKAPNNVRCALLRLAELKKRNAGSVRLGEVRVDVGASEQKL